MQALGLIDIKGGAGIRTLENVSGIVLQARPYGESHRTAVLLTERLGAVRVFAYGAQKARGPLHSSVQALVRGLFLLRTGDGRPAEVVQGVAVDMYDALRSDLRRAAYAQAVLELALGACRDETQHTGAHLYRATEGALAELRGGASGRLVAARMGLAVARELGVALSCERCMICGGELDGASCYSISDGGLVCAACCAPVGGATAAGVMRLRGALPTLRYACRRAPAGEERARGSRRTAQEGATRGGSEDSARLVLQVVLAHLAEYAGIVLKSVQVLDAVD